MTTQEEQKVLQGLYDTIFSAITYSPSSDKPAPFDPSRTLIQLSKNEAINPDDFANQLSPNNPNGSFNTAYNFFAMTDTVPTLTPTYAPSTRQVSKTYQDIVQSADTDAKVDPDQKTTYDENYDFLNTIQKLPLPGGKFSQTVVPTDIAQAYDDNQDDYITAVGGYRSAMLGYDLTKTEDQRSWNAVEPGLKININKAWNSWVRGGKANVELAQNALQSTINNIISAAIADAQAAVSPSNWLASGANNFLLTYPLPSDWNAGSGSSGATKFTYKSSVENTSSDSNANTYGGGGSFSYGLWSVGGSFEHTDSSQKSHFDGTYVEISAKMTLVRIMRPWLNSLLFSVKGWWLTGQGVNSISNGQLDGGNSNTMLPLIPTAFVVMNDVQIKADFTSKDEEIISQATSGSASVGWGPFSISGNYAHSESHSRANATYAGGVLSIPGMQVVAWVDEIMPASPSATAPAQ